MVWLWSINIQNLLPVAGGIVVYDSVYCVFVLIYKNEDELPDDDDDDDDDDDGNEILKNT